ncbi:MAG: Spy/CpxP family protein refolding chaperone [Bacteroidetes bacterium]|nr:Spy/CpxP family protein refolding chaperone [Bacteroidota bacterium]
MSARQVVIAVILLFLTGGPAVAQDDIIPEKQREKVKQIRIWKLTDKLNLTEEQSARFFAIYNRHSDDMEALRTERKKILNELKDNLNSWSESKITDKLAQIEEIEQKMVTRRKEFLKSTEPVLTVQQRAELVIFETEFLKDLAKMIEKRRENRKGN